MRVEICSGFPINLVKQSTAEALGLDIVVDDFGYDDYIDAPQSFVFPLVGWSCFTLFHKVKGYKLWFDGFVIEDDVGLGMDDMYPGRSSLHGAERRFRQTLQAPHYTFGDGKVFTYGEYTSD